MAGRFISFEGIDGAGKTTHIAALVELFRAAGAAVVATREPGGTPLAEALRGLLLHQPMDALTESLLVFAARRDHLRQVVEPALRRGDTVVCDRFTDASFAYQGGGRGVDVGCLRALENWVHGGLQPDLTLWFDVGVHDAALRRSGRVVPGGALTGQPPQASTAAEDGFMPAAALLATADAAVPDRFEAQGEAFFQRVRAGYAARLAEAPERIVRIDASLTREAVWEQVLVALRGREWV